VQFGVKQEGIKYNYGKISDAAIYSIEWDLRGDLMFSGDQNGNLNLFEKKECPKPKPVVAKVEDSPQVADGQQAGGKSDGNPLPVGAEKPPLGLKAPENMELSGMDMDDMELSGIDEAPNMAGRLNLTPAEPSKGPPNRNNLALHSKASPGQGTNPRNQNYPNAQR
jgi:hypothetical protein